MKKLSALLLMALCTLSLYAGENETAVVKKAVRTGTVTLVGNLLPDKDMMMDSEVGGLVEQIHVDTGDIVKKGDLLITLSSVMVDSMLVTMRNNYDGLVFGFREYKPYFAKQASEDFNELFLSLKQAETGLDFQKKEFSRAEKLFEKGAMAEADFDRIRNSFTLAETGVQLARAAIERQKLMIDNLRRDIAVLEKQEQLLKIRAPFSGRIVQVYSEVGEKIPGDPGGNFIRIIDDSRVVFKAGAPEEYYNSVRIGSDVSLSVPGQAKPLQVKITRVSPVVDAAGRTFDVEIEIDNSESLLKPGLFCRADLNVSREGLAVDSSFVLSDEKGDFVKNREGKLIPVRIQSSPAAGEIFITGEGISEGTELIKQR